MMNLVLPQDALPNMAGDGGSYLDWFRMANSFSPSSPGPSSSPMQLPNPGSGSPSPFGGMPSSELPTGWISPSSPTPSYSPLDFDPANLYGPYSGANLWGPIAPSPPPPSPTGGTETIVPFGGYRADGGPASPGAAYMVGENGPELVVPQTPSTVVPMGYNGDSMPTSSFGMTGIPGANPSGNNVAVPYSGGSSSPAIGGATNPLLPTYPSGQSVVSFPANTAGTTPTNFGATSGAFNPASSLGFGGSEKDFQKALEDAGFGKGISDLLWKFLSSGAGFNPQVANALINSMQPYVQRGEADILEQFSNMGLRNGSPAAIGMGDFLSQVNLNEQQIFAQMYEQAVSNYLSVLLSGKENQPTSGSGLGALLGGAGSLFNSIYGSLSKAPKPTPPVLPTVGSFF